jgi:hypothetical protein
MPDGRFDRATTRSCIHRMRWQATQEIAMACERRRGHDVVAAQLIECAQQVMLIAQPAFLFCDDGRTVAVGAYPERINPFGAASDVDVPNRTPDLRLFRMGDK